MILHDCQDLIKKFNLPMDDQILANNQTRGLFKDISKPPRKPLLRPGGATQNSIRTAQWLLGKPQATTFVGAIGDDVEVRLQLLSLDVDLPALLDLKPSFLLPRATIAP